MSAMAGARSRLTCLPIFGPAETCENGVLRAPRDLRSDNGPEFIATAIGGRRRSASRSGGGTTNDVQPHMSLQYQTSAEFKAGLVRQIEQPRGESREAAVLQ